MGGEGTRIVCDDLVVVYTAKSYDQLSLETRRGGTLPERHYTETLHSPVGELIGLHGVPRTTSYHIFCSVSLVGVQWDKTIRLIISGNPPVMSSPPLS